MGYIIVYEISHLGGSHPEIDYISSLDALPEAIAERLEYEENEGGAYIEDESDIPSYEVFEYSSVEYNKESVLAKALAILEEKREAQRLERERWQRARDERDLERLKRKLGK